MCKLSDFGGAKTIVEELEYKQSNIFKGTPNWMAPESVRYLEYTRFSDIWSLGCLVIEMFTGLPPWSECSNTMAVLFQLYNINRTPSLPSSMSRYCKDFVVKCLKINPRERANVHDLLRHPFITGYPLDQIVFTFKGDQRVFEEFHNHASSTDSSKSKESNNFFSSAVSSIERNEEKSNYNISSCVNRNNLSSNELQRTRLNEFIRSDFDDKAIRCISKDLLILNTNTAVQTNNASLNTSGFLVNKDHADSKLDVK